MASGFQQVNLQTHPKRRVPGQPGIPETPGTGATYPKKPSDPRTPTDSDPRTPTYPKKPRRPRQPQTPGSIPGQPKRRVPGTPGVPRQAAEAQLNQVAAQMRGTSGATRSGATGMQNTLTSTQQQAALRKRKQSLRVREPMRDMTMPFGKINY